MSSPQVFEGFWQNHSVSGIWGWTWTMNNSSANYLIAFLGIYLGFVGGSFWSIVAFLLHQLMAKQTASDGIHHQILLILRNSSSPFGAAKELASLAWYWRTHHPRSSRMKPFLLSIIPFIIAVGFIVAGIESARVSAGDASANEVRIKPQNCGQSEFSQQNLATEVAFATWLTTNGRNARAYSQSCYGNSSVSSGPSTCSSYAVDQIRFTTTSNQPCPFSEVLCITGPNSAVQLDTAYFDSHHVLGINAPPSSRISYRKLATCSVLNSSSYSSKYNLTNSDGSVFSVHRLFFGPLTYNYTYQQQDSSSNDGFGYEIQPIRYNPDEDNAWFPIPELIRTNADVNIFIMSANGVSYLDSVDDPFYAAHDSTLTPGYFRADNYYQVIGCAEQYQICVNTTTMNCTSLNSRFHIFQELHHINLNPAQVAAAEVVMNASITVNMFTSVFGIGSAALLARDQVFQEVLSGALPDNQWVLEAKNFFAISLARLQNYMTDYASKGQPTLDGETLSPATPEQQRYLCSNQKIRNIGGYQSFTAAAVWIVIGVGLVILILGYTIDKFFACVQGRPPRQSVKLMQWETDSKFQQQRIAMLASGHGTWAGSYASVPVTNLGDVLAVPRDVGGALLYQ